MPDTLCSGRVDNVRPISDASLPNMQHRGFTGTSYTTITKARANKYGFQGNSEQSKQSTGTRHAHAHAQSRSRCVLTYRCPGRRPHTGLPFADDVAEAIQDVSSDKTDTNWSVTAE